MNRKFRQVISSLLMLTFLLSATTVSAADMQTIPEPSPQRANWVKVGYYYGDTTIEDIFDHTILEVANILLQINEHGFIADMLSGVATLFKNTATSPNVTAYYKREMYRNQDDPRFWRDVMTYYYDANHTRPVGSPVQSNEYEMIDKQVEELLKKVS